MRGVKAEMLRALAALTVGLSVVTAESPSDVWKKWLDAPPQRAVGVAADLIQRADTLAAQLPVVGNATVRGAIDVVGSGGGNLDGYFLGVLMMLKRYVAKNPSAVSIERFNGASAGGMLPVEWVLKGENVTLVTHVAYGQLEEEWPLHYANSVIAGELQDQDWRTMSKWQFARWNGTFMNGRVWVTTTCLKPLPTAVRASDWSDPKLAAEAFMATGTTAIWFNGSLCTDGGAVSGPDMTPLFQDKKRPQLIVNLMKAGPTSWVFKVNVTIATELVKKGQDEALAFLRTGTTTSQGISLCPASADTSKNVCTSPNL